MPSRQSSKSTSAKPFLARVNALRKRIPTWRCDALLITNSRDIRYLTGFVGDDSWAIVSASSSRVTLLSDSRFDEEIARFAPQTKKVIRKSTVSLAQALNDELSNKSRNVEIQDAYVTLSQRRTLEDKVKGVTFVPVDDGLLNPRAVKDKTEAAEIRKAAAAKDIEVPLMGRNIPCQIEGDDIRALAKGKPVSPESAQKYLESKFGEDLEAAREAMEKLAKSYKPKDLADKAFGLYEKFRPNVPQGQKGWGAKGTLSLKTIRELGEKK